MDFLLVGSGAGLIVLAAVLRPGLSPVRKGRAVTAILAAGLVALLSSSVAQASHTEIWSAFYADLASPWNGYRVFLSSPRHADSGSRGECGWEENINGRHWNYYAASINTGSLGALEDRGYDVVVSPNARDENFQNSVAYANSWGADVYIVTHTNAFVGCGNPASYVRVMHRTGVANSLALRDELSYFLDQGLPGGSSPSTCDGLYECINVSTTHRAYVELFFHTNQADVNWFQGNGAEGSGGVNESWRYGASVDNRLGYPR